MCEVLVFLGDNTHQSAKKNRRGAWKRGMPIVVHDDGHQWGSLERKAVWQGQNPTPWPNQGKVGIVKIPGLPAQHAIPLVQGGRPSRSRRRTLSGRRNWHLSLNELPEAARESLLQNGEVTLGIDQLRACMRRRSDDAQFTGTA